MSPPETDDGETQTSYRDILEREMELGLSELRRSADGLFLSGLSAGLDIGFGPLLMAVMTTLAADALPEAITELLVANMYAVGFLFVILGRSELFTEHTTLAVLPVLDRKASLPALGRLWGVVFGANLVGGAAFAAFAVVLAPELGAVDVEAFRKIAEPLVKHSPWVLFGGAVLAGWLMGLLSWLVAASEDTVSRVLIILIVTGSIGLAHLPHSVAGNVEVLMGLFAGQGISVAEYLKFLAAAATGNAVGGAIFVALLKYGHVVQSVESLDVETE